MKSVDAFFPSPQQVVGTDIATLRTAGLSGRKAEYGKNPPLPRFFLSLIGLTGVQFEIWQPTSLMAASPPRNCLQQKMRNCILCSLLFVGLVE